MRKSPLFKIAAVILSATTAIAALEFSLRLFVDQSRLGLGIYDWRDGGDYFHDNFVYSDNLGFEPKNRCCAQKLKLENEAQVLGETNNQPYLILIVGDSITHRANYSESLDNKLNSIDRTRKYEVVSVGIESYNTFQEIEYLKTRILPELKPDLVIMQFTLNDFEYTPTVVKIGDEIAFFKSPIEKFTEKNVFLFRYSLLYRYFSLRNFIFATEVDKTQDWDAKENKMADTLGDLDFTLSQKGIPYFFLIYPFFSDQQPEPERELILSLLESKAIDYLDLLPIFQKHGSLGQWTIAAYGRVDIVHPSKQANIVATEALAEYILAREDQLIK